MNAERAVKFLSATASLTVGIIAWEVIGRLAEFRFLPPPSVVTVRAVDLMRNEGLLDTLLTSVGNLAVGAGLSIVFGIAIGVAMGIWWRVDAALSGIVNALLTAPTLVFAPIYFSIFGFSRWAIIALIVHYSIFLIIITTGDAMKHPPRDLMEMARSFNCDGWRMLRRVTFPSALPLILAGVRLGAGRSVKAMVNGEMFIAVVGLGAVIQGAGRRFDATTVLAVLGVTIFLAIGVQALLVALDRRMTTWLPSTQREM
jgi:ABC-type nitrate/sulfonate/bicarbonate transport system permease component